MKCTCRLLAVALLLALLPNLIAAADEGKSICLFDGKSLDGWDFYLVEPAVKMDDVWSVQEGVLVCKGEPKGYINTKRTFTNFKLTLQWRWAPGTKPGNSGVLLRATGKPQAFMLKCAEAQLHSGSAGDIWGFLGYKCTGAADRLREVKNNKVLGDFVGVGVAKHVEKEPGQWNTYEILFQGDKLTLSINGEKVNEATGCDIVPGTIALQSEGGEIHFRNIQITPLD